MFTTLANVIIAMSEVGHNKYAGSLNTAMLASPEEALTKAYLDGFRDAVSGTYMSKEAALCDEIGLYFGEALVNKIRFGG